MDGKLTKTPPPPEFGLARATCPSPSRGQCPGHARGLSGPGVPALLYYADLRVSELVRLALDELAPPALASIRSWAKATASAP
ncbi:MAG: hypothetical protein OXN89_17790 [Bryobacterales bacterium]|nr:hypothetical protein [Bryobacterales bacterium]